MDSQSRQQALDSITPEELEKIKAHQAKTKGAYPVDTEWMLLAEFAMAYGWQAYTDARDDKISAGEMMTLIEASRKLRYLRMYEDSHTAFIGAVSAQSKKPANTFRGLISNFINKSRTD